MIEIPHAILAQIKTEARQAYPYECCGLFVGRTGPDDTVSVKRAVSSPNLRTDDPRKRFEVDPRIHFEVLRSLRGSNERIVGHYHSHPDHPAQPSETDLEMALDPELTWIIIGVTATQVTEVNAFSLLADGRAFVPQLLVDMP